MAAMKCPHCGSEYVIKKGTTDSMDKSTDNYYCQACKKNFGIDTGKETAKGTWLMTFYEKHSLGSDFIEVYKKADGSTSINQKKNGVHISKDCTLELKLIANQYISDPNNKYSIQVSSYKTPNDSTGNLFFVGKIKMNKELAKAAMKNEAMKIISRGEDTFELVDYGSQKINQDVMNYLVPIIGAKTGGCYVATAVYGSYDCPEVWTLRRFRDFTLAETWYGRAFVRAYYAISPTLVKWFGNTKWFKKLWKGTLDRMVRNLNEQGVENTRYEDKIW